VGFDVIENLVEIVEAGDFTHSATDLLYCIQETLRTNKNQRVLTFYQKASDQKDFILCTLFHTVPTLVLSAYPSCRFRTARKALLWFFMQNKKAI